jgi:hypothetical protein
MELGIDLLLIFFSISSEILTIDLPDTSEIVLGYSFVIKGSDSLWCGEKLLSRDSAYIINYQKGTLKIRERCSLPVKIKFSHLDIFLNETYLKWVPDTVKPFNAEITDDFASRDKNQLIISGNKGLFVDVKSSGTDINQSLLMKIGGRAGQFDVSGVLSDENIPQGAISQSLREIDEIFIEAISDNMSFRIGDIVTVEEDVDKRLLGVSSSWGGTSGVAGVSKAKYGKNTFKTTENRQGPYKISPEENLSGISLVRGSEQVWLNGKLLENGKEKDYVIDYSENSLTFNPSVFLDNESVVLVLFQYSIYGESNVFYKVGFENSDYLFSFIRKEDFSDKDLIESYPDSGFGYRYSAVNVGEGNGDYELQDSVFVYVGYKNGSYEVYFEWVGEGNGEYSYVDSLHYFLWTGTGPYSAKKKVPLGEKDNLLSFGFNKKSEKFVVSSDVKTRRIEVPVGGSEKDGLKAKINTELYPYKFLILSANYSKKTHDFVTREWEGEKDLLRTWELSRFPSDFFEGGVKLIPNSRIVCSYTYGKADSLRKDKVNFNFSPFYFYWDNIENYRQVLKGGFKFNNYEAFYSDLRRRDDYRKEISLGRSYLTLIYGLEGKNQVDTAKVYTAKTDFNYKGVSFIASQVYRKYLSTGEIKGITNGTLNMNFNLNSFNFRSQFNISRKMASIWEKYYQNVNIGEGNYSFDSTSNTYYENPYGNYVQRIVYTGEEIDSKEYSASVSIRNENVILFNGYLNSTYNPALISTNDGLMNVKFPKESKNRIFLKGNFKSSKGEAFMGFPDRDYKRIDFGWENSSIGYKEIGLTREWGLEEDKSGGYISFWNEKGIELKIEGLFTTGEDTLFSPILGLGYRISGNKKNGLIQLTLGYNYYPDANVNSYRMNDLYPPGFFYDLNSSLTFDLTNQIHLVINGKVHELSTGKIYYNARMGITADFNP